MYHVSIRCISEHRRFLYYRVLCSTLPRYQLPRFIFFPCDIK